VAFSRFDPGVTPAARIGLGLAAVGRPGYLNLGRARDLPDERTPDALRRRTHELLDAAHAAGVRYVDAARSYGRAEEFLAGWLRARPDAADVVVGSKWGYTYTAAWRADAEVHEVKDHGAATLDRQYAETRALLGDRLDLYQIHSVTPGSPALSDPGVLERLERLAGAGVSVGLSTSGPRQAESIRAALGVTRGGRPLFSTVQATFNVLEPSAGPALAEAHAAGLTVIVKEAMANGRLAAADAPPALRRLAEETGAGHDTIALAAVLHQSWTGIVLSGAATVPQLESNLAAARLRLDTEQLARLAGLAEPADAYWRHRSAMAWR
jgi:aryl-alcohol dehydrogenase-like predicted oxidoreductase